MSTSNILDQNKLSAIQSNELITNSMKAACIILTLLVAIAIMAVCVMVKFATDITVEDREEYGWKGAGVYELKRSMGVISLSENTSKIAGKRFPYVAAIIKNSSGTWSFSCFASIILVKWVVTAAHCRKLGFTHRVLLYHDFIRNYTHTYPIIFWRVHEHFNISDPHPRYDIAVAKINVDYFPMVMKPAVLDERVASNYLDVSVWKTVSTMDKKMYLTNDFDRFEGRVDKGLRCFESYGYEIDDRLICVDFSHYEDCFSHEFGPLFEGDKVVGVLAVKPHDCDVKYAIFTNVSFYSHWVLKVTHAPHHG